MERHTAKQSQLYQKELRSFLFTPEPYQCVRCPQADDQHLQRPEGLGIDEQQSALISNEIIIDLPIGSVAVLGLVAVGAVHPGVQKLAA